jgi:hypothetical protein
MRGVSVTILNKIYGAIRCLEAAAERLDKYNDGKSESLHQAIVMYRITAKDAELAYQQLEKGE